MSYYRRNSDERTRQLERQARSGDTGAINALYIAKKRTGDPGADAELFSLKVAVGQIPEPQIDLFSRLGFKPAIDAVILKRYADKPELAQAYIQGISHKKPKLPRGISLKLLKELGQVAAVKLVSASLQKTFGLVLRSIPWVEILNDAEIDSREFEKNCFYAVQELRNWRPRTKLDKKHKKILKHYEGILDSMSYPYRSQGRNLYNIVSDLHTAFGGRLTRKGATGYSRDADDILRGVSEIWDSDYEDERLESDCEGLHCLGEQIIPMLVEDLLLEKVERVPHLDMDNPDYYKQEVTAKRFTAVTVWLVSGRNKHIIVWTDDETEAEVRAKKVATHMGWEIKRLTYNQDRMHASHLLEKGLHEGEMLQEGFEAKLTRSEIRARETIHHLRVQFMGGKDKYLQEATRRGKRTFPGKRFTKRQLARVQQDVGCFIEKLLSIGFNNYRDRDEEDIAENETGYIGVDGILKSFAANIADTYAVDFYLQRKDPRWSKISDFAKECGGEDFGIVRGF